MINDATLTIWDEVQQQQVFMINDVNLTALEFHKFPEHQVLIISSLHCIHISTTTYDLLVPPTSEEPLLRGGEAL